MDLIAQFAADPRLATDRAAPPDPAGRCVVYWMRSAQRALDNPALETAIAIANQIAQPVVVYFGLRPQVAHASLRHFAFMLEGLADTAARLVHRKIGFVMRLVDRDRAADEFARFCAEVRQAAIVVDRTPLRAADGWRAVIPAAPGAPVWCVDANVIVPIAVIGREHYAARTIRPRMAAVLERFLVPVGNRRVRVAWAPARAPATLEPSRELLAALPLDRSVGAVSGFRGGTTEALARLGRFIAQRLPDYATARNAPDQDGTSQLSPYLHYGQIAPHTIALAVRDAAAPAQDIRAFSEELIVRRELAINFAAWNPRHATLDGCEPWALRTLARHARDRRAPLYRERELENAATHDPLWNAAQRQMIEAGWMHGYPRMYWAKKILEWSRSARAAFAVAVRLNDRYELDGRDPNGYAGIAWAIGGKHDRAWGPERPIYGTIRYMSAARTGRKFNSRAYIARWSDGPPAGPRARR
ncbi:MAG: deoxyribodipyrimidine photo-lyase [Candidatus Binataceae bacterium]|nr:deoxyribodipyrimidine photo-lyase [Candidatus Binataceae bacterium]